MINSGELVSENHCSGWDHSTSDALNTISTGVDSDQDLSLSFQSDSSSDFEASLYVGCSVLYILLISMPGSFMITGKVEPWCRHFGFHNSSLRVTRTVVAHCSEWLINQTLFIDRLYILPHYWYS